MIGRKGQRPGTRELVVGNTPFTIIYRVHKIVIQIGRILHQARAMRCNPSFCVHHIALAGYPWIKSGVTRPAVSLGFDPGRLDHASPLRGFAAQVFGKLLRCAADYHTAIGEEFLRHGRRNEDLINLRVQTQNDFA